MDLKMAPVDNGPWDLDIFFDHIRRTCPGAWHGELRRKFSLHPVVLRMVTDHRPVDHSKLIMEWPHISETDTARLAYTRTPADGQANRQLVTAIGKYLSRHWPHISDHLRRDAQVLFTPDTMYFVHTIPEIVQGIELGPYSCMSSKSQSLEFTEVHHQQMLRWMNDQTKLEPPWEAHPYTAYDPALGWHMALRKGSDGIIMARAMCNGKDYVRTYRRGNDVDTYSHADEVLAAWLKAQGYKHRSYWPDGTHLRCSMTRPGHEGIPQCPYVDGSVQRIEQLNDDIYIVSQDGDYDAECTGGFAQKVDDDDDDGDDDYCTCEDCGDRYHGDDMTNVGRSEHRIVCGGCLDNNYQLVRAHSRNNDYREYYIHENNAFPVENQSYYIDPDYPPHDIVRLENGYYAEADETVCIEGECYLDGDDDIVELDAENPRNGDTHALKEHTWVCFATNKIYHLETKCVEVAGEKYHPDAAPDEETISTLKMFNSAAAETLTT